MPAFPWQGESEEPALTQRLPPMSFMKPDVLFSRQPSVEKVNSETRVSVPKAADLFLQISPHLCQTCPAFLSGLFQSCTRKPTFQQSLPLSGLPSPPTTALARPSPLISPCGCSRPQLRVLSTWRRASPFPQHQTLEPPVDRARTSLSW